MIQVQLRTRFFRMAAATAGRTARRLGGVAAMLSLALASAGAHAQTTPANLVVKPVSNEERTILRGNVHPLARPEFDRGLVPESTPTGRMLLLLRHSDAQDTALRHYLSDVQNPASPRYRKWLTPEGYGKAYGISDSDLAAVEQWLKSTGLKVEKVPASRNMIVFSGTVGTLQNAFHTSIHEYAVGNEQHIANAEEPQIPQALASVIAGVSPINDFRAKPMHTPARRAHYDSETRRFKPDLNFYYFGDVLLFVDPADAATIYDTPNQNLNANAQTTYDGSGTTIGVVGYSNFNSQDVQNYRQLFLNEQFPNLPQVTVDGDDPGIIPGSPAIETLLDLEISGGLAPGANIHYYTALSTDIQDGLTLAILRALDDNQVNILSVSYGNCEAALGAAGNQMFSALWEQAAAQGITVVVASGDSGSAGCDDDNTETAASGGLAVSGLASTPYNVAVGGTDFQVLRDDFSSYVNLSNGGLPPYYETALGYIPEVPWNDSPNTNYALADNVAYVDLYGNTNIVGAGGGKSSQAWCSVALDENGNCPQALAGYPKPPFQSSVTPNDGVRDIPDVSILAADTVNDVSWLLCSDSLSNGYSGSVSTDCQLSDGQLNGATLDWVGGTSAATPALAGMLALVSQSQGGARLGQVNNILYNLSTSHPEVFHDITVGNNSVVCADGSPDCNSNDFLTGYETTTGYDYASGLGSLDVTALVNAWSSVSFVPTSTNFAVGTSADSLGSGGITVTHGTPLVFQAAVSPASATGDFSVLKTDASGNTTASYYDFNPLGSNGIGQFTSTDLPGGTYTISAYYGGDVTHTASQSNSVNVTIQQEASTTALNINAFDPATRQQISGTTIPYGSLTFADAQPYGANSQTVNGQLTPDGVPTGSVTFTTSSTAAPTPVTSSVAINSLGAAEIPLTLLAAGQSYTYQASYGGDASFLSSSSSPQTISITKGTTEITLDPASATLASTDVLQIVVTLATNSLADFPVGDAVLSANGHTYYEQARQTIPLSSGVDAVQWLFSVGANSLASGANTLTVSYGGDANYLPATGTASVTVNGDTTGSGAFSLAGPANGITIPAPGQSATGTVTLTPANGFYGDVTWTCSVSAATSGTTPTCIAPPAVSVASASAITTSVTVGSSADTPSGSYTITLTATGGSASSSVTIPLQVVPPISPSFAISTGSQALSISAAGQSATETITLTPSGGFTGTVNLSCSVSAASSGVAPTCSIPSTASITGSAAVTATLTVNTTAPSTARNNGSHILADRAGTIALGFLVICLIPKRRNWLGALALVLLAGSFGVIGCGGGGDHNPTTPPSGGTAAGTYTITVTAASGSITSTQQVKLTVQ